MKSKYEVPSLKLAFDMMEMLSRKPKGCLLTEISEKLQCPVSSAYRMSMALEEMALVSRESDTKILRLTNKLLDIGQRAVTENNLIENALDIMRQLRDEVSDTVLIGVRDDTEIVVLDEALGTRMFAFISKLGYRIGVSCSAPGKAVLAFLPESEREAVIGRVKFVKYNDRTLMDPETLRKELAKIAKQGFAFDNAEQFEGVYCVGAPVLDRSGYPVAAVWTTGLMMDVKRRDVPALGAKVAAAAKRISERL